MTNSEAHNPHATPPTPDALDAIRARVEAATEGRWEVDEIGGVWRDHHRVAEQATDPDAEFIAHARTDVELLVAALAQEQVRANRAELQRDVAKMQHDECHHAFEIARDRLVAAEGAIKRVRKVIASSQRRSMQTVDTVTLQRRVLKALDGTDAPTASLAPVTTDETEGGGRK